MTTLKQHRYVSLVGPVAWPGIATAVAAEALSAAEYEGWPLAPLALRHPLRTGWAMRMAGGTSLHETQWD